MVKGELVVIDDEYDVNSDGDDDDDSDDDESDGRDSDDANHDIAQW